MRRHTLREEMMDSKISVEQQIIELLSNPANFRTWLKSFEPNTGVGVTLHCDKCPIAHFLKAKNIKDIEVYSKKITTLDYSNILVSYDKLPCLELVNRFITQLDNEIENEEDSYDLPAQISAATSLDILDKVLST